MKPTPRTQRPAAGRAASPGRRGGAGKNRRRASGEPAVAAFAVLDRASPDATLLATTSGKIVAANAAALRLLGRSAAAITRLGCAGVLGARHARFLPALDGRRRTATVHGLAEVARAKGGKRLVGVSATSFRDGTQAGYTRIVLRPTPAPAARESATQPSRTVFERLERVADAGSWEWHIRRDVVTWSAGLFRIFGRPPALGAPSFADLPGLLEPASLRRLTHAVRRTRQEGKPYEVELRVIRPDGSIRVCIARGFAVASADGQVRHLYGSLQDVTQRRETDAALRRSEERFRAIFEHAPLGVVLGDLQGRLLSTNPAFQRLLGYAEGELVGMDFRRFSHEADLPPETALIGEMLAGKRDHYEIEKRYVRKDGRLIWVRVSTAIIRNPDGEPVYGLATAQDITARKQLEAERAEALARLAVVEEEERHRIARELHDQTAQRLVALALDLKTLEINLAEGRAPDTALKTLRQNVDALQQQVRELAWDLRTRELEGGTLDSALKEFAEEWSERTRVRFDYVARGLAGNSLPRAVKATLFRIAQEALLNIERHARASQVSLLLERDQGLARLTIEDNGRGFAVEAAEQAPLASRRLGLLGMRERVGLVGGRLLIESTPGVGTTLLVRIPIREDAESS